MPPTPARPRTLLRSALRLRTVVLLALTLAGPFTHAAESASGWLYHAWETNDGVPNNNVNCVAQAPDGAMLFATRMGLTRFDGWRLREFPTPFIAKGARDVTAVLPALDGTLWVFKGGALVALPASATPAPLPIPEAARGQRLTSFFEHQDGTVWFEFDGRPPCRVTAGRMEVAPVAEELGSGPPSSIAEDSTGGVWLGLPNALARWRDGRFEKVASLPDARVSLCAAKAGGLWIGSGRQLFRFTETKGLVESDRLPPGPAGAGASTLLEDRRGGLWFGTLEDGLYLRSAGEGKGPPGFQKVAISNNDVWWLCEDYEGSLWVATGGGGVCRVRPRVLTMLDEPGAPVRKTARALCADSRGDLWVLLQTGHLFRCLAGHWESLGEGSPAAVPLSTCLVAANDGSVWIATIESDLLRWDGARFEPVPLPPKDAGSRRIRALLTTRDGTLWIGRGNSVVHGRPSEWTTLPAPGDVQSLAEDEKGRVWLGTTAGALCVVENGQLANRTPAELDDNGGIRALLSTADGSLWIGTGAAGLARLKDGHCTLLTTAHGLPDNVVSQLALDAQGRLWAAGDRGIFFTVLDELAAVAEGRAETARCVAFDRSEGTPNLQANSGYSPNSFVAPDGRIWFATRAGIAIADPRVAGSNWVPPRVAIDELRLNGKSASLPADNNVRLALGPGVKDLQFILSAMSFVAPAQVAMRHRLDGVNTDWVTSPRDRVVSYAHLAPGDYTLHVRAANNDGIWSEREAALAFTVRPYFWQTAWFYLVLALAALAVAVFAAHIISERRLRRQAELLRRETAIERERTRIARDMHDQLGASLTQITLLSELARADDTEEHLPRLAETAREATTALDEIVWAVNPRHDNLPSLLEYLGQQTHDLLAAAGIRCRLDFPDNVPPRHLPADFRHNLFLIVREAVNNATKYAASTEVRLSLALTATDLRVTIADDGRGFSERAVTSASNGLLNMRTRAADLGGECTIQSQPGSGTTVSLCFPWPDTSASSHP